jgi:aminopeptidase N
VFPCFDQPNLKAYFKLYLSCPNSWTAVSNETRKAHIKDFKYAEERVKQVTETTLHAPKLCDNFAFFEFEQTAQPIPTYTIAFCAGDFVEIEDISYSM